MLLGGDELGRTQRGNNNAYCQDNELAWFDWSAVDEDLVDFTAGLIKLRRAHPGLRRRRFLRGRPGDDGLLDLGWFRPDGEPMEDDDWATGVLSVGAFFNGDAITERGRSGERLVDDSFYFCSNSYWEPETFHLPTGYGEGWEVAVDTGGWTVATTTRFQGGDAVAVGARSLVVLRRPPLATSVSPS